MRRVMHAHCTSRERAQRKASTHRHFNDLFGKVRFGNDIISFLASMHNTAQHRSLAAGKLWRCSEFVLIYQNDGLLSNFSVIVKRDGKYSVNATSDPGLG